MNINDLTPRQKTAIILTSLPQEVANSILMTFSPEERRAINAEFIKVKNIPEEIKQQVLNEFLQKNKQTIIQQKQEEEKKEDIPSISQNLDKLLNKPTQQQQPISSFTTKTSKPLDFLAAINPKKIYWVLRNESNNTIAFVLSQLTPTVAQRILSVFPTSQQTEINKYISTIKQVDIKIVEAVSKFLRQELEEIDIPQESQAQSTTPSIPKTTTVQQTEKSSLSTSSIVISNKKIDFADISLLKPQDIEHLLKLTNKNDWVSALKGVDKEIADKILSLLPPIQSKVIRKDLENTTVSKEEILKAQRDILFKLKGLVTIGKVKI